LKEKKSETAQINNLPDTSPKNVLNSIPIDSKLPKSKWAPKNWDILLADDENSDEEKVNQNSDDESDDEYESSKKKRLSMSPLNKIEDTLFWLKDQSKKSNYYFENKELSLTGMLGLMNKLKKTQILIFINFL
jgi:hypothetical protein